MLTEFARWWSQQMMGLVPQRFLGGPRWSTALILDMGRGGGQSLLVRRQAQRETALGPIDWDDTGVSAIRRSRRSRGGALALLMRVPPGSLLEHRFAIPLVAERDAANFLRYEIDRVTPFSADELFWTFETERRDRATGRLFVRLSMLPRAELGSTVSWLNRAGLVPAAIEAAGDDDRMRYLPIGSIATEQGTISRALTRLAAITCAALAVVAVVLPFLLQQIELQRLDRQTAMLQPGVTEVYTLRRRIDGQAAGADVVAGEHNRVGDALQILAAITGILPDNTFLTALSLSKRNLTISGQSADAVGVISALSSAPIIRDPSFSAPVTTAPDGHGSLFAISAGLAP